MPFLLVSYVYAAGTHRTDGFCSDNRNGWARLVELFRRRVGVVVAHDVTNSQTAHSKRSERRRGDSHGPRAVLFHCDPLNGWQDMKAEFRFRLALLVPHRPRENAGMIPVSPDEILNLCQAFRIRRH